MTAAALRPTPAVRPATVEDTPAVCALLAEVFAANPKADPAVYRWQYVDNPLGPAGAVVAEADGRIVAHAAFFTAPGLLAGEGVLLAHGGDAAVHPTFRGQGVFTAVTRTRYARAAEAGAAATLVLPNPDAVRGNVSAGLRVVGRVPAWVRPLDVGALARRARVPAAAVRLAARVAFRGGGAGDAEVVDRPPTGLDALWHRQAAARVGDGFARDAAWWRWRYADRPDSDYRYAVARAGEHLTACVAFADRPAGAMTFRYLFDLVALELAPARAAVAAALEAEPAAGVAGAALLGLHGTWAATLAAGCGFRRLPRRLEPRPMTLGVVPHLGADGIAEREWLVSWGDHDHL